MSSTHPIRRARSSRPNSPASIDELGLEIQGRTLILAGIRGPAAVEGDVYQQVEIGRGRFRRTIELGADIEPSQARARYEDGMLRIELPLAQPGTRTTAVPIESSDTP
jgi:HSP20 family protein